MKACENHPIKAEGELVALNSLQKILNKCMQEFLRVFVSTLIPLHTLLSLEMLDSQLGEEILIF